MDFKRITINPAACGGKPCIRGLRFPVSRLLGLLAACNATPGAYAASPKAVSGLSTDRLGSGEVEIRLTTYGYQGYDLYRYRPDSEIWEKVKAGSLQDSQVTKVLDKPSTGAQKATYKIRLKDRAGQTDEIGPFDVALMESGQEHQPAPKQGVLGLLDLLFNQIFGRKAWAF